MFGGFSMPKQGKAMWVPVTDSWEYDPQADTWSRLPPMPMPRHGLAGGFIANRFHMVSGSVQSGSNEPGLVTNTDRHDVLVIDGK